MKFVSIDIETTGLNPQTCQILEIGAVAYDTDKPEPLGVFQCFVKHDLYVGEAFALQMNAWILQILSKGNTHDKNIYSEESAVTMFGEWLNAVLPSGRVTYAGKNYGSFDLQFLKRMKGWEAAARASYRSIDVGSLFLESNDLTIPTLQVCIERAGIEGKVRHDALGDAMDAGECILYKFRSMT